MDGVIADFHRASVELLQKTPRKITNDFWPDEDWQRIKNKPHFFSTIPKMARADELMDIAYKFRDELNWSLYILTAIPHLNDIPDCFQDKIDWIREHFPTVSVRFGPYSKDKHHHCTPGDILVDDRESNCLEWRARGGIAVQVTEDYDLALKELGDLLSRSR